MILITVLLICPVFGYSDIVSTRNGDKLHGKVLNPSFTLQIPYGQMNIKKDFLNRIAFDDSKSVSWAIQSINNDRFSGDILNKNIQLLLDNGNKKTIAKEIVKLVKLETQGPSYRITTAIFTMKNKDRFSGKVLSSELKVKTSYMLTSIRTEEINRIEFEDDFKADAKILLTNGSLIQGKLLIDEILLSPDSAAELSVVKSEFSKIQFNAHKMVLKEYRHLSPLEKDGDGDGVSDQEDRCPHTPWREPVDDYGCSKVIISKQSGTPNADKNARQQDMDDDGVPDYLDQCPQTPTSAKVDTKGCWVIQDILFDFDSDMVKPQYYAILDEVIVVLKKNPGLMFEIRGSSDNIGSEKYNQSLSKRRARRVKVYMIGKGVEAQKLTAVGYGSKYNSAANDTSAGRALNRRIDFIPIRK
jgi:outer membrane protein OmpA-like peptidoglycan-associated protein